MDTFKKEKSEPTALEVHWPKIERKQWLEEYLDDHFHCVLCGGELKFQHKVDFVAGHVTEEAHCPSCRVRNRQSLHRMQ